MMAELKVEFEKRDTVDVPINEEELKEFLAREDVSDATADEIKEFIEAGDVHGQISPYLGDYGNILRFDVAKVLPES